MTTLDDSIVEEPETVRIRLIDGPGYDLSEYAYAREATVWIEDDDGGPSLWDWWPGRRTPTAS